MSCCSQRTAHEGKGACKVLGALQVALVET
jgi:hypothetical protein